MSAADEVFVLLHSPVAGPGTWLATARALGRRGHRWQVVHLPGGHLHMLVDPDAVAGALVELTAARAS